MKELFDNCLKNLALLGIWNREEFLQVFNIINSLSMTDYYTFDTINYNHKAYPDLYIVGSVVVFDNNHEQVAEVKTKHVK